jgi:SAM-dependent methyltransferase
MGGARTPLDYDAGWERWSDMVKYSPAPIHRRRLIRSLARTVNPKSVLDVGCGTGETLRVLRDAVHPTRMVGVDLSPAVIESNRRLMPYAEFHAVDVRTALLDERFDLIVASEVLEHIDDYSQALTHLRRMCAGHMVVTVPAGPIFPIDHHMGHVQHFTPDELARALAKASFEVRVSWQWGFPWHSLYRRVINGSPNAMLKRFGDGPYSLSDKLVSRAVDALFYTNLKRFGNQLVVLAEAV